MIDLYCPHCEEEFQVEKPFDFTGEQLCPECDEHIYVEVDESEEGPTFTAYKEMP